MSADTHLRNLVRDAARFGSSPEPRLGAVARRARSIRTRWILGVAAATIVLATGMVLPLHALIPAGNRSVAGETTAGYGIHVTLPTDWAGRFTYVEGMPGPVLQAATIALPETGEQFGIAASEALGPQDAAIGLYEFTALCPCDGFAPAGAPISLGPENERQALPEGHTFLELAFEVNGRSFVLWAEIGSRPAPDSVLVAIDEATRSLTFETAAGPPAPVQAEAAGPPTFQADGAWRTASDAVHDFDPVTWATNVPFPLSQLRVFAEYDELGLIPTEILDTLPGDGIVIVASLVPRQSDEPGLEFPDRSLPLSLSDATVNPRWEFQPPGSDIPWYQLTARSDGHLIRVDVYFGTANPSDALLETAQRQFDRMVLPG